MQKDRVLVKKKEEFKKFKIWCQKFHSHLVIPSTAVHHIWSSKAGVRALVLSL